MGQNNTIVLCMYVCIGVKTYKIVCMYVCILLCMLICIYVCMCIVCHDSNRSMVVDMVIRTALLCDMITIRARGPNLLLLQDIFSSMRR